MKKETKKKATTTKKEKNQTTKKTPIKKEETIKEEVKEKIKKTKGMSVAEFNNKRFDKRPRTGKSYNNKNVNNKMNQKYFNDYMKRNEQYFNNDNNVNTNIKKNRDKSPSF